MHGSVSSFPRKRSRWLCGLEATSRWGLFYHMQFLPCTSDIHDATAFVQTIMLLDCSRLCESFFLPLATFLYRPLIRRPPRQVRAAQRLYRPINPVTCGCVHKAFVRWQPNACRTAAGLWGLAVTIFIGAVVPGVVEDVGALWKTSLAAVCLLVFFAAVASIFACGFGTRVEQSGGQQEPPADVAAFA